MNYEIGASKLVGTNTRITGAVFYYDVQNMIQAVAIAPATQCGGTATICTQMQNVGKVQTKGAELGITGTPTEALEIGANYTLLIRTNVSNPAILLTDVPQRKLFTYSKWQISEPWSVLASLETSSSRFSSTDGKRIAGGFGIANLKGMYQFNQACSAEFGINNLLDRNYMLIEGYPMEGRNYFANATVKF